MNSSSGHHYPFKNGSNGHQPFSNYASGSQFSEDKSDDEIDLIKVVNTLLRNKWTLAAFLAVFSIIAAVLSLRQTPIYSSEGTIFITESKNRYSYAGSDLSNLLTTTYGIGVGSTIANELQILKSRSLSMELADSLIRKEFTENGKKFPLLWRAYPVDSTTIGKDTVAQRIRSKLIAEQQNPESDLLHLIFESPLPEEASFIVNLTMDTYSKLSTEQNRAMASSALKFLRGEKSSIKEQLSNTEENLKQFMDETQLVALDPQTQELISTISTLESKKQEIHVQLVAVNSAISTYTNQLDEVKPGLADQYSESLGPILERYQYALAELETEKLLLLSKNPELRESSDNPELNRLNKQIAETKKQIRSAADRLINSESTLSLSFLDSQSGSISQKIIGIHQKLIELQVDQNQYETQIEFLNERINSLNSQFESLPEEMIELARLERDVKINEELYMLVSNQFAEMSLWEKTQFGKGRPLDYAVTPQKPVKPRKKLWVVIGFLLGGMFGVAFIFIRDAMDDTIKSSDVLRSYDVPFLGNVPDFGLLDHFNPDESHLIEGKRVSNQLVTFLDHISPISEAYRRLRINIVYANPDKDYKVLMVTSSTKGEGKSTLASNLAVTFSESEKSVLVVDLDLRRPTLHRVWGENREPGLVELLFSTAGFKDVIKSTIAPNVDLITAGQNTPEPASVLDSRRLKQIIDKLGEHYDHIILDTAPYGIISDSASLLRLVDGLIIVSRFNRTTRKELEFTLDGLKHLNADIVGLVLNAFDPKKSTDYYTNYAYYKRTYAEYYEEEKNLV